MTAIITTARIADMITEITNADDDMLWNIIRSWDEYDDEATTEADPSYQSDVICLTDGSRIAWDHQSRTWRHYLGH